LDLQQTPAKVSLFLDLQNQHQTGEKDTQTIIFRSSIMSLMVFR
jgi:hypothetical protein